MPSHYFVVWGKALLAKEALFPEFLAVNLSLVTTIQTEEGYRPSVYQLLCGGA